ncbi:MAG: YihA family ribosome biogenesis GTP-binding protein [Clostridiales bacterium]|nr:YihA family ribosome biogenesis GTP-binding protein [Clostridiales bacterium]
MHFNNVEFETSFGTQAQLPASEMPEIAFAGRSNVGKSSLLNKILNRKSLARTSSMPGKTITVNFFKGVGFRFVDLPGYGYAKVSQTEKTRWAGLMEAYFKTSRNICLVVPLIDMRHKPSADDYIMLNFLKESGYHFVIAMTKCDKLNKTQRLKRLEELEEELSDFPTNQRIPFSSQTGEGVEEVQQVISDTLTSYEQESK